MTLRELIERLRLEPIQVGDAEAIEVSGAYCGDLLSDVMAHAKPGVVWFTVQAHVNAIAVAQLRDLACVVLVNGVAPDPQAVWKAGEQGVSLCGSSEGAAELCMKLAGVW
jgi:hypothetical protein